MRVVYYVRPSGLDHVLPQALALNRRAQVHLIFETAPESKNSGTLGPLPGNLSEGVHQDGWQSLIGWLPFELESRLRKIAGVHRVVHDCPRAFYPQTIAVAARAARFIRSLRPDVVHFDETWTRAAWTFPMLGCIPIVANVHDMEEHPGDGQSRIQTVRRFAWRRVAHLIFHSEHCQRLYWARCDMPGVPSTVVPFGVLDVFRAWQRQTLPPEPRTILFFGRLSAYKGLRVLLAAAPQIAGQVARVRFIIAGSAVRDFVFPELPALPQDGQYEVLAQYIPNDLMCELFQRATVVVLPYESATQSGVVMTAYAFAKPVVATCVGGLPEVVEDGVTGRLVPPQDPHALAEAVVELLGHPSVRSRMAEAIRQKVQGEFSWERHAEKVMEVYRLVTNGQRRRL